MDSSKLPGSSKPHKKKSRPFPLVGIGASAGGFDAVKELLENLKPNLGMAFIYIQHLDPSHDSILPQLL